MGGRGTQGDSLGWDPCHAGPCLSQAKRHPARACHPPASRALQQGSSLYFIPARRWWPHSCALTLLTHSLTLMGCTEESMIKCTQRVDVLYRSKPTDAISFSRCFPGNSSSPVYLDFPLPVALLSRWDLVFLIHGWECSEEHR